MADTAKRLVGPVQLGTVAATLYTVPTGTAILRNIHVSNGSNKAVQFYMSIGVDAQGTRYFDAVSVQAHDAFDWSGFLAMVAGEVVQAFASVGSSLVITISGVETT